MHVILDSNHTVVPVTGEEDVKFRRLMSGHTDGTIRLQPEGWYFNSAYAKLANEFYNFKFRSSDVVITSYPKCGSTWTQEIVWTMMNNPNFNHPDAALSINIRVSFLDLDRMRAKGASCDSSNLEMIRKLPGPRIIKTHNPLALLAPELLSTSKVIYITRDPKAVSVSHHHHCSLFKFSGYCGTFEEFLELFLQDELFYSPFFTHILDAWNRRSDPNLLFLFYEDMKINPMKEYKRIDKFLGTNLSEKQLENIISYTDFTNMKQNTKLVPQESDDSDIMNKDVLTAEGGFFRKGLIDDWKSKLNKEQVERIDHWIDKNTKGTDFKFTEHFNATYIN